MTTATTADTIAAPATPAAPGAVAMIRISGPKAIETADSAWRGKSLASTPSHTVRVGHYIQTDGSVLDQCVAAVFRGPNSFTGEDTVEISTHGSPWIVRAMMADLMRRGVKAAGPGEFTQRAFINGRLDLTQAEAIADLISASSRAAHDVAVSQTRGRFAKDLARLRDKLTELAALIELELDFSEEDVQFADRPQLLELAKSIQSRTESLARSYRAGNVIKNGINVVIAGMPNAGKSSLLNHLLNDDKAIVSDIPGTTRDTIEDTVELNGLTYRFTDTAGLRHSDDPVEKIGIERAHRCLDNAAVVIWMFDPTQNPQMQISEYREFTNRRPEVPVLKLLGKSDLAVEAKRRAELENAIGEGCVSISLKTGSGIDGMLRLLTDMTAPRVDTENETVVTNARHYEALESARVAITRVIEGLEQGLPTDLLTQDVRETLHHLGAITGSITTPAILHTIFSRFCIGK